MSVKKTIKFPTTGSITTKVFTGSGSFDVREEMLKDSKDVVDKV